jgi:putative transposase
MSPVPSILRRKAWSENRSWPNAKLVYRVIKAHGMLLQRQTGAIDTPRHDGASTSRIPIYVGSDGFEIGCDNKEEVLACPHWVTRLEC